MASLSMATVSSLKLEWGEAGGGGETFLLTLLLPPPFAHPMNIKCDIPAMCSAAAEGLNH